MLLQYVSLGDIAFYAFALLVALGALGAVASRSLVYSAFALLGALFGVAALFAWLSADYVAITQVVVYVGGILVLFLFAVMLTHTITNVRASNPAHGQITALVVSSAVFGVLGWVALSTPWQTLETPTPRETTHAIGDALLGPYLLPFEVLSVVLLAAMVGAVVIARKEIKGS